MHTDNELAEMLIKQGISFSKSHALEMAADMNSTGKKVNDHFNDKKEEVTMGFKTKPLDMSNPYIQDNIKQLRENAINSKPLDVQTHYETPENGFVETTAIEPEAPAPVQEPVSTKEETAEAQVDLTDMFNFGKK